MGFSENDSIVQPRPLKNFGRELVLCIPYDPAPRLLEATLKERALATRTTGPSRFYDLGDRIVLSPCLGGPAAVLALETIAASGGRRVIVLSFCGSLSKRIHIGDPVVICRAYSDEGTSRHYFPRKRVHPSSAGLSSWIKSYLSESHIPFDQVSCVSTDAPFRETRAWMSSWKTKGAAVVDMETAAIFALSAYRGFEAASLMLVTDELYTGEWKVRPPGPHFLKKIESLFLPFLRPGGPGKPTVSR